ncbi:MAG: carbohydrate ABC transporter permease [Oscillospiraceae bacterium]|jgi:multiple sugar transport system permease protein|nr:carbohydrate ABC transporter permease [Oscillospiraceae bacterium]
MTETKAKKTFRIGFKVVIYIVCIILGIMSILPFIIMFVNATRSSVQIQQQALSLVPSNFLADNMRALSRGRTFNAIVGFRNSMIISSGATICATYFSCLTAYALTAYDWRFRKSVFTFIVAVMMIPGQLSAIGFVQFMYNINMVNNFLPFILPAIAAPPIVFFMRQYLLSTFSLDIVNAARIDGSHEFRTFNFIVLPMMKPAIAMQAIFVFVGTWNQLLMPMILLTDVRLYTMPIMVRQLSGNLYNTNFGSVYLGLSMSVLPLFIVYFSLSKYIIAGVQLGGVKE